MLGRKTGIYWRLCWGLIIPVGLLANLIYMKVDTPIFKAAGGEKDYPTEATGKNLNLKTYSITGS